ncbi:MAG TPA: molybdenum cofactor guanylyltransferase [Alcanivorax sp.]|nr:molybdenum cofactor guanylyltransferase [Alcanivorax sp.]
MHEHSGVIGVVLAGGGSRRMGRDKALLEWQGRPLMTSIRERLLAAGCATVVTSRDEPGCVADYFPGLGPLGGIHAVVRRCPAAGYLVAPVDMPLMPASLLGRLIDTGLEHGHCYYGRSFLPCYLDGGAGLEALLAQRLTRGELSLAGALRTLRARALDGGDELFFLNTNTPETWRMANTLKEAGS